MMADADIAVQRLHELKALGVLIAMDDFGTGLLVAQLPQPASRSTSSRWTARSSPASTSDCGLAAAIIGDRQRPRASRSSPRASSGRSRSTSLQDLGCELGQGFLFARPMPPTRSPSYLASDAGGRATPLDAMQHSLRGARPPRRLRPRRPPRSAESPRLPPALGRDDASRSSATGSSSSPWRGQAYAALERARGALDHRHRDDRADDRVPAARRRRQRPLRPAPRACCGRTSAARAVVGVLAVLALTRHARRSGRSSRSSRSTASAPAFFTPAFEAIVPDSCRPTSCRRRTRSTSSSARSRCGSPARRSAARSSPASGAGAHSRSTPRRSSRRRVAVFAIRPPARRAPSTSSRRSSAVRGGLPLRPAARLALGHAALGRDRLPRLHGPGGGAAARTWSRTTLHASAGDLGLVFAAGGIGAVGAALVMGQRGQPRRDDDVHVRDLDARDAGRRRLRPRRRRRGS